MKDWTPLRDVADVRNPCMRQHSFAFSLTRRALQVYQAIMDAHKEDEEEEEDSDDDPPPPPPPYSVSPQEPQRAPARVVAAPAPAPVKPQPPPPPAQDEAEKKNHQRLLDGQQVTLPSSSLSSSQAGSKTRQTSTLSVTRGDKSPQAFIKSIMSQFNQAIRLNPSSVEQGDAQDNPLVLSLQKLIIQLSKSSCRLVSTDLIALAIAVLDEFAAPTQFSGALLPSKKDASASIDDVRENSPQFWVLETVHLVLVANMQSSTMSEVLGTIELGPKLVQLQELCFDRLSPGCSAAVRTEAAQCLGALSGISVATVGDILGQKLEAAVGIRVQGVGKALGKLGLGNTKEDERNVAERRAASYMRALRLVDFHFRYDVNSDPPNQKVSFQDSVSFLQKFAGLMDQVQWSALRISASFMVDLFSYTGGTRRAAQRDQLQPEGGVRVSVGRAAVHCLW